MPSLYRLYISWAPWKRQHVISCRSRSETSCSWSRHSPALPESHTRSTTPETCCSRGSDPLWWSTGADPLCPHRPRPWPRPSQSSCHWRFPPWKVWWRSVRISAGGCWWRTWGGREGCPRRQGAWRWGAWRGAPAGWTWRAGAWAEWGWWRPGGWCGPCWAPSVAMATTPGGSRSRWGRRILSGLEIGRWVPGGASCRRRRCWRSGAMARERPVVATGTGQWSAGLAGSGWRSSRRTAVVAEGAIVSCRSGRRWSGDRSRPGRSAGSWTCVVCLGRRSNPPSPARKKKTQNLGQVLRYRSLSTMESGQMKFHTRLVEPSWRTPSCTATTAIVWIPDLNCASHVRGYCKKKKQNDNRQLSSYGHRTNKDVQQWRLTRVLTGSREACQGERKLISFSRGSLNTHLWLLSTATLPINLEGNRLSELGLEKQSN